MDTIILKYLQIVDLNGDLIKFFHFMIILIQIKIANSLCYDDDALHTSVHRFNLQRRDFLL